MFLLYSSEIFKYFTVAIYQHMISAKNLRVIAFILLSLSISLLTFMSLASVNARCVDWCDLRFVDTDIDDKTLRVGQELRVFVKLKMRFDDDDDPSAKVTVIVEGDRDPSKTRIFSFSYSGQKISKWFEFDTDDWDTGTYTVRVKARGECNCDYISKRIGTVTLSKYYYKYYPEVKYVYYPQKYVYVEDDEQHCLSIDKIWTNEPLKAGERVKAYVRVGSCGTATERDVKVKLTAFSRTHYTNYFMIPRGGTQDVSFTVTVPEDAVGSHSFEAMAWNNYKSDTWSKNLDIKASKPMISVKPEYRVEDCKINRIAFIVTNDGDVKDTFTLSLSGPAAGWITGVPEKITLNPGQADRINAYVSVPCDTDEDFNQFRITANDYTVTSSLRVKKPFMWPRFSFPTGFFIGGTGIFIWLPWILLFIMLILFYWMGNEIVNERKRPMFY